MTGSNVGITKIPRLRYRNSHDAREHGLKTVIVSSCDELPGVRDDWLLLRERHGMLTTWADPDRYLDELRVSPDSVKPHVVVFQEDGKARALIVARISSRRLTYRLGYWKLYTPKLRCLDVVYGGLITDGTPVARDAVVAHLNRLVRERRVEVVNVNHLPLDNHLYGALRMKQRVSCVIEPHWTLTIIPGSYDATLSQLSGSRRRQLRRHDRVLVKHFGGDVQLRVFTTPDQVQELINGTVKISSKTYQAGLGCTIQDTPVWREILTTAARHGHLRCYWLVCGGRPIAFMTGAVYGTTYFGEYMGYLPEYRSLSPGRLLHARVFRDLCMAGLNTYDYGFGDADYKRIYGSQSRDEAILSWYGLTLRANCAFLMQYVGGGVGRLASEAFRKVGLLIWMKRKWRMRKESVDWNPKER